MKLLLDTCIFLWYIKDEAVLDPKNREMIRNPENQIYLSSVSIWECLLKHNQKDKNGQPKLPLPTTDSPAKYLVKQREKHQIASLALDESCVCNLPKLPSVSQDNRELHKDPFDHILICQSMAHHLVMMTADREIWRYAEEIQGFDCQRV